MRASSARPPAQACPARCIARQRRPHPPPPPAAPPPPPIQQTIPWTGLWASNPCPTPCPLLQPQVDLCFSSPPSPHPTHTNTPAAHLSGTQAAPPARRQPQHQRASCRPPPCPQGLAAEAGRRQDSSTQQRKPGDRDQQSGGPTAGPYVRNANEQKGGTLCSAVQHVTRCHQEDSPAG